MNSYPLFADEHRRIHDLLDRAWALDREAEGLLNRAYEALEILQQIVALESQLHAMFDRKQKQQTRTGLPPRS